MNATAELTYTQRIMIAASLEIDGRTDRASMAAVGGPITEHTYVRNDAGQHVPYSEPAKRREAIRAGLNSMIALLGIDGTTKALRLA